MGDMEPSAGGARDASLRLLLLIHDAGCWDGQVQMTRVIQAEKGARRVRMQGEVGVGTKACEEVLVK